MRIAIRDTTDSHTVGFFDNRAGIKFKSAEMTQFLKGACSYVSIKYRSKDVEKVRAGCKLAFRHKGKDYWLTINEFNKQGTEVEITAYSLSLEANKEKRGAYKASSAMSIVDYFSVFDPEKSLEIGINEVSDKKLTLEWTGTDTVLARLYSLANYFDAELEFVTELNPDYSLKRHVVNIYRSGNLGGDSTGRPVRVGTDLKVLGFNSNINDLYTAIDVTGKDGLKLPDKTIKDAKGEVQFFSKNGRLYAPQARDKFPSNKVKTQDRYILADAKSTEYTDQEALFGYALSEMKKHCDVQVEYSTEGAVKGSVGDTKTLIDSINFEPTLYVQARITEQTEDLETGKSLKTTFSNFKRTSSQLSNDLTKKIEELAKNAVPHRIVMITSNGTSFKNGTGQSIVSPKLFKGDAEITDATYRFNFNNNTVAGLNYTVNASAVNGTSVLKIDAYVGNDVVASDELTFINVNDGLNGSKGADGNGIASTAITYQAGTSATVAPTGTWSSSPISVPAGQFLWTRTIFTYTDTTTKTIYNVSRQGDDGKTPYWHTAWANSADGKTDFSLTDPTGRKYRGDYTDYTQVDSTDPTKYKWVDMTANVKVGGANILLNSRFENTSTDPYSFTVGGVTYNTKPDYWSLYNSGIPNATTSYHAYVDKSMSVTNVIAFNESDGSRNWKAINQTVSSRVPNTSKDFMISLDMYATGAGTKAYGGFYYVSKSTGAFNFHAGQFNIVPSAIGKWVRESAKVPFNPDDCDFTKEIRFYIYGYGFTTNSILYIDKIMLENSNVASDHSDAPEELQAKIDSKADQALTQAQMLALEERSALARDNAIAEAMKNTISEVEAKWQTWYNLNTADEKQKVANDIASLFERVAEFKENLGEASAKFSFINNETLIGEEGVAIGDKEGKAKLFLSNDSISFVTNGVAQMTLTGDTLTIKNGLFTERIQIGNYVEEVYDRNPLYNIIRPIKYS